MDKKDIERVVSGIDVSTFPIPVTLTVGTCTETGRPKISAGLSAPDTKAEALRVKTGVKAGGIDPNWPPHTIVLGENWTEYDIVLGARMAIGRAVQHEIDEHFKFRGELFIDPHPNG